MIIIENREELIVGAIELTESVYGEIDRDEAVYVLETREVDDEEWKKALLLVYDSLVEIVLAEDIICTLKFFPYGGINKAMESILYEELTARLDNLLDLIVSFEDLKIKAQALELAKIISKLIRYSERIGMNVDDLLGKIFVKISKIKDPIFKGDIISIIYSEIN